MMNNDITRKMLDSIRNSTLKHIHKNHLWEDYDNAYGDNTSHREDEEDRYIPITNDDKFGNETLNQNKNDLQQALEANIQFPKYCLLYNKRRKDIIFFGTILDLNNLNFKFVFNDNSGCGCYIWNEYKGGSQEEVAIGSDRGNGDGCKLQLTDENLKKVGLILAGYKNWKKFWLDNKSLVF